MFIPKRILVEKEAMNYDMGHNILDFFKEDKNIEVIQLTNNRINERIPGESLYDIYREGKNTLVIGIKKGFKFQTCKPSANYQLPLMSGCMGHCQYCYLNTNLGKKPYVKVYVNIEDILKQAQKYITERLPETTIFEGSATSDPVALEPYTNSLKQTIKFFSETNSGGFRFVTKYTDVDTLLNINHNNKTEIRFTLNTNKMIKEYEGRNPSLEKRLEACTKILDAGYPLGFIIAPILLYENWKEDYHRLLLSIYNSLPKNKVHPLTFEIISHRFTTRAKNIITEVFPNNSLPMNEDDRAFKYGQFGYGKYIYKKPEIDEIKEFFQSQINSIFEHANIKYII